MLNTNSGFKTVACLAASILISAAASAATIYENASGDLGQFADLGNVEYGEQVNFAGTDRILTGYRLSYFADVGAGASAQVRLYNLAGEFPGATPFYDSGVIALGDGDAGFGTLVGSGLNVPVGNEIVYTVTFSGLDGAESGGLLYYGAPEIGSNTGEFFRNTGTGWEILDTPGVVDGFAAQFTAVPEPSTWALLVGGLGVLGFYSRRRKA